MKDFYRLVGELTIPEEKKDELNSQILKLMEKCGIRKIQDKMIGDRTIKVAAIPVPDKDGKVHFDYSLFEKKVREECTYNIRTCELCLGDCGFAEFGLAMMLVITILESYSSTRCYLVLDNQLCEVNYRALVIENILGTRLRFPYRADIWGMYLFCREHDEIKQIDIDDVSDLYPEDFEDLNVEQLADVWQLDDDSTSQSYLEVPQEEDEKTKDTTPRLYWRKVLYTKLPGIEAEEKELKEYLKRLFKMPYEDRKNEAELKTGFAMLAECSLHLSVPTMIWIYAYTKHLDFWQTYYELTDGTYYSGPTNKTYKKTTDRRELPFYKAIWKNSEDELLGLWSDRKLDLSEEMVDAMKAWKEEINIITIPDDFDTENELSNTMYDIARYWDLCIPDDRIISTFSENKDNERYQKWILLLQKHVYKYVDCFPELTKNQAINWIAGHCRNGFDAVELNGIRNVILDEKLFADIWNW